VRTWVKLSLPGLLLLNLFPGGCISAPRDFTEKDWRARIEAARVQDLYAPHVKEDRYFNPWMPMGERGFLSFLAWKLTPGRNNPSGFDDFLPAVLPDMAARIKAMPDGDFILWVGHATFLMRLGGEFWLTDPMFSERALLPKRQTPPAIHASDLKELGIKKLNVVISHNHYDHLDRRSIEDLPEDTRFYVPMGLKPFVENLGKKNVIEMDWWQKAADGRGIEVVCLPAQHWSRRIGQPAGSTLWASFLIITPAVTVYFGGDSGYFIGYREIGKRYPGIDYALMPTTAYRPRWFMHYAHMDVDETLDAFDDLKARYFIPTQWGVFQLGDEPAGYPALELRQKLVEQRRDPSRFIIMDIGQIIPVKKNGP